MISLVILGQMTMSLPLDQFGVLSAGYPITAARAIGALMLFGGAMLNV